MTQTTHEAVGKTADLAPPIPLTSGQNLAPAQPETNRIEEPFVDDTVNTDPASPLGWSESGETFGNNCLVQDDQVG